MTHAIYNNVPDITLLQEEIKISRALLPLGEVHTGPCESDWIGKTCGKATCKLAKARKYVDDKDLLKPQTISEAHDMAEVVKLFVKLEAARSQMRQFQRLFVPGQDELVKKLEKNLYEHPIAAKLIAEAKL